MIYLLTGIDTAAKDSRIEEIKKKVLLSKDALRFDLDILDGNKLSPAELKKSLISLPAIGKKRLLIIRSVEKLSPHNKDLITDSIRSKQEYLDIILETGKVSAKNSFIAGIRADVKAFHFGTEENIDVFKMTKAMSSMDLQEALKILHKLFLKGDHPVQIMGALVWFWGRSRNRLSSGSFKKGLLCLQEADLNIKRSRMEPGYAVEVVVVKLCSLLTY